MKEFSKPNALSASPDQDIGGLLESHARTDGDRVFLKMKDASLTYEEVNETSNRCAHGLKNQGVQAGDVVCLMLPNCVEFLFTWFALLKLGAVAAPINTAFKGSLLSHTLNLSGASVLVADEAYIGSLEDVGAGVTKLETLIVRGGASPASHLLGLDVQPFDTLFEETASQPDRSGPMSSSGLFLFTSGTTGPSKACMLSHRFAIRSAEVMIENLGLTRDDCLYCPFPLFHADATINTIMPALLMGGQAAIGARFSASRFWDEIRKFEATVFDFMGATLTILWKAERSPSDGENPARLAWGVPMPSFWQEFENRFRLRLVEVYGLTEAGLVIYDPLNRPHLDGSCGQAVHPFDVRILNDAGFEVPPKEVGEIAIRALEPSVIMDGYFAMHEATLEVFRDLWFHTGDLGYRDREGNFFFVGRKKDAIRRRGENISAFEIEQIVETHPAVLEVAAVGVPSELTEEDVKICVVRHPERTLTAPELLEFCDSRMAPFMVPRYVEFMEELPKTPTEKIEKQELRNRGITKHTWDREQH